MSRVLPVLKEFKLGDLFGLKHGYAFKSAYFVEESDKVVVTPGNFYDQGGFKDKGAKEKWYDGPIPEGFELKQGDIIVAMTEQMYGLLGSSAIIPLSGKYLHNQRLGLLKDIDNSKIIKKYAYYLFNTKIVRDQIQATANGAKVRHTSIPKILDVKVSIPDIFYQKKAVSVLTAYDRLIENNNRRIAILEDMAQSLYREWFVHFRFPGHEQVRFVDSSLGRVPEGWEVVPISDIASLKYGKMPKKDKMVDSGTPIFSGYRITGYYPEQMFDESKVIVVARGVGGTGDVKMSPEKCWLTNLSIAVLEKKELLTKTYLFYRLASSNLRELDTGSAQSQITIANLSTYKILLPDLKLQEQFDSLCLEYWMLIGNLKKKNSNLKYQRDMLLPKLISGQIQL